MPNPIPVIAILLCTLCASAQGVPGFGVHLKSGTVTPERNITDTNLARFNQQSARSGGKNFLVIQFDRVLSETEKATLGSMGIHLHDFIPNLAYTATVSGDLNASTLRSFSARSIISLSPLQKMEPSLAAGNIPSWSVREAGAIEAWISHPAGFSTGEVIGALKDKGVELLSTELKEYRVLSIRVEPARLIEIAELPCIEYIQPAPPPASPLNVESLWLSRANVLKAPLVVGGKALTGNGVTIGIGDDGDPQTHLDFKGRLINRTGWYPANHATHVNGTAGGAGLINELYEGYAPKATLVTQMFDGIISNAPRYVTDHGMVITNNSYGFVVNDCPFNGLYDLPARVIDQLAIDIPALTHVVAAGNDGNRVCAPYAQGFHTVLGGYQTAKNVITVGSTNVRGEVGSTSSRGPVKDGRIKPEITSTGVFLPSTWGGNIYSYNTGTSMAAPGVSGGLALLVEQYRAANGNLDPESGLLKAYLLNSGFDAGNAGPDFKFGFGRMNLNRASSMMENNRVFNTTVSQGITNTHQVNVPANTAQLKVALYWLDPPASILSAKTLVNDLDLVVESGSGTVLPFRLDTTAANLDAAATTGADHVNNIEQVVISNPTPGPFDLKVTGTSIVQNPSQEYFLVYDFVPVSLALTNPIGGEHFLESVISNLDSVHIQWDSYGTSESGFTVEFFNGSTWTTLSAAVEGWKRILGWKVPQNLSTNAARIRVTGNTSLLQSTSEPFVIHPTPDLDLSLNQCEGYIAIEWNSLLGVTDYEVMLLQGNQWATVATVNQLNYVFSGLSADSVYWVTIRPLVNGTPGRRAVAVARRPYNGNFLSGISYDDLSLVSIFSPSRSGRENTSTALTSSETVTIRIKNLDDVAVSGNINVSYSLNGTPMDAAVIAPVIPAGGTYDHSFGVTADLSATGNYLIEAAISSINDPVPENNLLARTVRQLENDAIVSGDLPWLDDLETLPVQEHLTDRMGLTGADRYDFISGNNDTGRIRSFINTGIAYSGSKALTLDSWISSKGTVDSLTATFNLGSFTTTDDIRIDFRYKNHGQRSNAANRVWIRGSDQDNWIEIYDLYANQAPNDGSYKLMHSVEINDSLAAYSQNYSTSLQLRMGQWGLHMAADNESGAGYSFDDFRIYRAIDDIQLISIDTPVLITCGLSAMVPVKVVVRNTSASVINNIPIFLEVDGTPVASEIIPSIPANDTIHYTFIALANLASFGDHLVEVYVDLPSDNVPENDTLQIIARNVKLVNSFPYLENFENGDGTWYTIDSSRGSWDYGTPSSAKINRAASGNKAWKTNIYGYYNNNETSYLYSPCFDVSSMSIPTLSFSLSLDIEDGGAINFYDGAWMDYSTDGGFTWQRLGGVGQGTNWYNRNYSGQQVWSQQDYQRWHVATIPLPTSNSLRFRFGFRSDEGLTKDGIAIDDIHIYDNLYGIYTGTGESPASVQPVVNGSNWIDFLVGGQLIASVNPGGQDLGSTEAKSYVHTGGVRVNKQQYYHDRNITIKPTNVNLPDSAIVRFYFLDSETEALINATGCPGCYKPSMAYELGVTKYSDPNDTYENGTLADNLQGNYLFINAAKAVKVPFDKGYYAEFSVKDFSEFWLNNGGFDNNTPLPAELISFTATKNGSDVLLKWTTASEQDVDHFEVEVARGNQDYILGQFIKLGDQPSAGNSTTEQHYVFTDQELNKSGNRYYRLRIVDIDGRVKYSPVRIVSFNTEFTWQVYPNPSDGRFTLSSQAMPGEWIRLRVLNTDGKTLKEQELRGTGFAQSIPVDLSHPGFAPGIYLLEVSTDSGKQVFRLVKQQP